MRLNLHNIGKLKDASVDIKGITVIAGENNTGKSTVGKALFLYLHALKDIDDYIQKDSAETMQRELRQPMDDFDFLCRQISGAQRRHKVSKASEIRHDYAIKIINDDYDSLDQLVTELARDHAALYDLNEVDFLHSKDQFNHWIVTTAAKIEGLLHVDHRSIANRKVSNDVERYFSGNIITIGAKSADIYAEYDGGKRHNTLTFERDSKGAKDLCKSIEREENTSARPVYIESPKTLDQLYRVSKGSTGVAGYFTEILAPNALGTNIDEQSISAAETPTTATQQVQATDLLDEFKGNITDTVGGILQFNTTSGLQFMEDGHSRMVDISNLSNGIKSLTLLEYAVECGCLGQGDFLILDEPEINLHPAWQIKYAEQIVRLQTVLNLNVVLTTHTPYFFEAMELYARQYKVTDKCHYYLTDLINGTIQLTDVTANTQPIYEKLAKPLEDLDALREKLDSQDR